MRYLEDFVVGQELTYVGSHEVTADEIVAIGKQWDPQPFHVDAEAAKDSIFGGLVASSVHLFAIAVKLGNRGDGQATAAVSALGFTDVKVAAPARPGDVLRIRGRCIENRVSKSRPGCGVMTIQCELVNQQDEIVFSYVSASLLRRRDAA